METDLDQLQFIVWLCRNGEMLKYTKARQTGNEDGNNQPPYLTLHGTASVAQVKKGVVGLNSSGENIYCL
jgi:hypothetical protein